MSFIRPDVQEALLRWRGALLGGAVALAGGFVAWSGLGLNRMLGLVAIAIGLLFLWDAVRRVRFPAQGGGLGVVEVDERQITYFGPDGGDAISLEELKTVRIETNDLAPFAADLFWQFDDIFGRRLVIPGDAEGANLLFDALSALPGADYDKVIAASHSTKPASFLIWQRAQEVLH